MAQTLRQRLRKDKINCLPWKIYRWEIRLMPLSAQTLFARRGIPWDILERELIGEGYLFEGENLIEILKKPENLHRKKHYEMQEEIPPDFGDFPNNWTEEDFEDYFSQRGNQQTLSEGCYENIPF